MPKKKMLTDCVQVNACCGGIPNTQAASFPNTNVWSAKENPEKRPKPSSWYPWISSREEISPALRASAQTFRRPVSVFALHLIRFRFRDDVRLIVVHVVERQFRPRRDGLRSKEGEVVDVDVGVVVRGRVDGAVGVAGVVDEAGGPAEAHAVADVLGASVLLAPLVQAHEVDVLVRGPRLAAPVGFVVGDDFPAVGVDELASFEVLRASES